ncbi:hypothetical protein HUN41_00249 [Streptomyces phage Coruscant]|uniref:Uncharacterized protein n=1 Tax=Streptomyces phage Coruscant TaxID=2739834 RepID=A0A7G4AWE8_9CAUD|nr:hypothetical protein PP454_gp079 [Streptomyces phage Coruscant]QMP84338.1 hypothetical protein HUN41_00249 [Streptomyces phage Coruscant]
MDINEGATVILMDCPNADGNWDNFKARALPRVQADVEDGMLRLQPLSDRPDGRGMAWFWCDITLVKSYE